jgi:hypothetical protein
VRFEYFEVPEEDLEDLFGNEGVRAGRFQVFYDLTLLGNNGFRSGDVASGFPQTGLSHVRPPDSAPRKPKMQEPASVKI